MFLLFLAGQLTATVVLAHVVCALTHAMLLRAHASPLTPQDAYTLDGLDPEGEGRVLRLFLYTAAIAKPTRTSVRLPPARGALRGSGSGAHPSARSAAPQHARRRVSNDALHHVP